jgi:predicted NBD/HSP70 family sugar kinase
MVSEVRRQVPDWEYEAVSLGLPAPVGKDGLGAEPGNLGGGWVGFDFAGAFGSPVKLINDAAMQALGAYEGGRMLFLGRCTGLGSTLIADRVIIPLELGRMPYADAALVDYLRKEGLQKYARRGGCGRSTRSFRS